MTNKHAIDKEISQAIPSLSKEQISAATTSLLSYVKNGLTSGRRIEIRGFGSLSLRTKNVFLAGSRDKTKRITKTVYFRMSKNFIQGC